MTGYRVLVDENFSPRTAERLRERGHEAVASVNVDELGRGASDGAIAEYARERGYAVVTNDTDFLTPELEGRCQVLFVVDDTLLAHELAELVDRLAELVDQEELGETSRLSDANLP